MEILGQDYERRLKAMGGRGSRPLPRRREDRVIILHALADRLARTTPPWTERQVTETIQDWMLGPGRFLSECDAVTLRRALVDEGFLDRDAAGSRYVASSRYERWLRFVDPPADPNRLLDREEVGGMR